MNHYAKETTNHTLYAFDLFHTPRGPLLFFQKRDARICVAFVRMKSPLRKLRGFGLGKHGSKESTDAAEPLAEFDDLNKAMQDIQDIRDCYEALLAASAGIANCAYEFSQALQDMATCLLQKTTLNIDEESGRIFKMLAKVQHELHKMFDHYRAHISQTITAPSESLLNELQNVEELKNQCDKKREVYDYMRMQRAKGKSKNGKVDHFSAQQLKSTKEEYNDHATFLVYRLMSLKQGQSRSLLTQTARHHTAQLQLFRKGLASLEALEPHVKHIAEQQHIDHQLSEFEDDGGVSFDFRQSNCELDESASSEYSMQMNTEKAQGLRHGIAGQAMPSSKSAPILPCADANVDGIERIQEMRLEALAQKSLHTYALPTPVSSRNMNVTGGTNDSLVGMKPAGASGAVSFQRFTSPLEQCKGQDLGQKKVSVTDQSHGEPHNSISGPLMRSSYIPKGQLYPEESNARTKAKPMPLPSSVEQMPPQMFDAPATSDSKRIKRNAHSGPLTDKLWPGKPAVSSSAALPTVSMESSVKSGPASRSPKPCTLTSPKISPSRSPPNLSPSHVSQLYELPKPPVDSAKPSKPTHLIAHSAPLAARKCQDSSTIKPPALTISKPASPLPPPPLGLVTRSLSIPSFGKKGQSQRMQISEEVSSPPLTPIPFSAGNATLLNTRTPAVSRQKG